MADPWELILYHTYTGTPGVISDQSPGRGSHGVAVNLPDGDFFADGATAGSGAVAFEPMSSIRVAASKSWSPIRGLRAEVLCECATDSVTTTLIDGGSFTFWARGPHFGAKFSSSPSHNVRIDTHLNPIVPNFVLPQNRWMTLGFLHDGAGTMELYFDGTTVARVHTPLWPIDPVNSVSIGNSHPPSAAIDGSVDDVKIWRINPQRVDAEFLGRPVDAGVRQCLVDWTRAVGGALRADPQCARQVSDLLDRAVASISREALNHSGATRARFEDAAQEYRHLWSQGDLDKIVPVLADLVSWLQMAGLDPLDNADVAALLNDECLPTILAAIPPLDCDPLFTGLLRDAAKTVENRDRHRRLPSSELEG
jgi:Concanavalin A-like lectin/glucanases superfamily